MYELPKKLLKKVMTIRNEKIELRLMKLRPSMMSWAGFPPPVLVTRGTFRLKAMAAMTRKLAPAR